MPSQHETGADLLEEKVFTVGERAFRWADVVDAARYWGEAVKTGELDHLAQKLALRLAASAALGQQVQKDSLDAEALDTLEALYNQFTRAEIRDSAIEKEIGAHRLDWTVLNFLSVRHPQQSAMTEFVLSIADGEDLAAVAQRAGVAATEEQFEIGDTKPPLSEAVVSATPGQVVGPIKIAGEDDYWLGIVKERMVPSKDNPDSKEKARQFLHDQRISGALKEYIQWAN